MKIGRGVREISRSYLRNVNGCNVDITDRKGLLLAPLKWIQMA
jgi:hypothetical protein